MATRPDQAGKKAGKKKNPYGEGSLQVQGQPRRFGTEQEYQACFMEYIKTCGDKQLLPNVAGFCVFADITKETHYKQQEYYSDSYQKVRAALEDSLINHQTFGQKNPAMAIVQGKNTFGWDDRPGRQEGDTPVDFDADEVEIDNLLSKLGYFAISGE